MGEPVSYKLAPGENVLPFHHDEAVIMKRAAFMTGHMWVTPYAQREMFAAGNYPQQHAGGDGLPKWMSKNRNLKDEDVVVWYTFGHNHIPRLEDWPVMPVAYTGFSLRPSGFFDRNPARFFQENKPINYNDFTTLSIIRINSKHFLVNKAPK